MKSPVSWRAISGVLLLDKPLGISSNLALQKARRLFAAAKAGHTGTLDPLATGLLPICFGQATKFSHALLESDKTYQALVRLGRVTTSGDAEGEVVSVCPVAVSLDDVMSVLAGFTGTILQIPPMHSALKHQGKPLYAYAREGIEVPRAGREVTIYKLHCDGLRGEELKLTVRCSKGTYLRVLAQDIGSALGCGAFLQALRRTATGGFSLEQAVTLPQLEALDLAQRDALLQGCDSPLINLPEVVVDEAVAQRLQYGQVVDHPATAGCLGVVRLYGPGRHFLGMGEAASDGSLIPRRLLSPETAVPEQSSSSFA